MGFSRVGFGAGERRVSVVGSWGSESRESGSDPGFGTLGFFTFQIVCGVKSPPSEGCENTWSENALGRVSGEGAGSP